jgi:hypothetical protein
MLQSIAVVLVAVQHFFQSRSWGSTLRQEDFLRSDVSPAGSHHDADFIRPEF